MLEIWGSLNGVQIGRGPIFTATDAQIVLAELGQFSDSSITLPSSDARALLAMRPYTVLDVYQQGIEGPITSGYVLNPRQQVSDNGDGTIQLTLAHLTTELLWYRTGREWTAANWLSVIVARLGALVPGWSAVFTGTGSAINDVVASVSLDNPTVLAGFLDTGKQFSCYVRQGIDVNSAPNRSLEMGQFGHAPTQTLVSGNGGNAERISGLIASVDRTPNDVSALINIVVPFGGGSGDSLVTLERCWRIVNDPTYPHYGSWGTPDSVFPEYDPRWPISDPEHPPGSYPPGDLRQGPSGTRRVTLGGHYDYVVYDRDSFLTYGHKEGTFVDSSLNYTDPSPANQELTARALYLSAIANFERFAHPHDTFQCTVANATNRPTRAGDLIAIDYQKVTVSEHGAVVEMNVVENLRVMRIERTFTSTGPPSDTYTLSSLGRFDETDASGQADLSRQMVALQLNRGTGLASIHLPWAENIDAANPIIIPWYVVPEHYRYHAVRLQCDFYPFRGTATTAVNQTGTHIVTVGAVEIIIPARIDLTAAQKPIPALPIHTHPIPIRPDTFNMTVPALNQAFAPNRYLWMGGDGDGQVTIFSNNHSGTFYTGQPPGSGIDVTPTNHTHDVAKANDQIAHIPAGTPLADLPQHSHDLEKHIPGNHTGEPTPPSPVSIAMTINGVGLSIGAATTGSRDSSGAFTSSFVCNDIGPYLDLYPPGSLVTIQFNAGTSGGNPFGVGYLRLMFTGVEELGGNVNTVIAG
jgi:hypothetical protein